MTSSSTVDTDDEHTPPGTSGLMPVTGTSCGIRPDVDALEHSEGFDFSAATHLKPRSEETMAETVSTPEPDTSLQPPSSD